MSLLESIHEDLITALKAKDEVRTSTLRLLKSALQYVSLEKKIEDPDDELVLSVIQKQAKQRKDSIESYENAGRSELKEREEQELHILEAYLPEQLSDEELSALIAQTITETGAQVKKDMGMVMKTVLAKVQGQADGKRVSQLAGQMLQ